MCFWKGIFRPNFRRLQAETRQMLEEFAAENPNIKFRFTDPLEEGGNANEIATQFYEMGMTPARINVVENGRTSEAIVFPWAMANYGNKSVAIPLLKNQLGATTEDRVASSVQQLEYAFADAFGKLLEPKRKKIAVMRGNGELSRPSYCRLYKEHSGILFYCSFYPGFCGCKSAGNFGAA